MTTLLLPRQLARFAEGRSKIDRPETDLASLMAALGAQFPQFAEAALDGSGRISPFVGVFVDGRQLAGDEDPSMVELPAGSTVQLVAAVAGG